MSLLDIDSNIEDQSFVQRNIGNIFQQVLNVDGLERDEFDFENEDSKSIYRVKDNIIYISPRINQLFWLRSVLMAVPDKEPILLFDKAFTEGENNNINFPVGLKQDYNPEVLRRNDYSWITKEFDKALTHDIIFPSQMEEVYYVGPMSFKGEGRYTDNIEYINSFRMLETPPYHTDTNFNLLTQQFPKLRNVRDLSVIGTFDLKIDYKNLKIKKIRIEQPILSSKLLDSTGFTSTVGLRYFNPYSDTYQWVPLTQLLARFSHKDLNTDWNFFDSEVHNFFKNNPGVFDIEFVCPGKTFSLRRIYNDII